MSSVTMVSGIGALATAVTRGTDAFVGASARGAGVVVGGATAGIAGAGSGGYAASALAAASGTGRAAASGAGNVAAAPFARLHQQFGQGFEGGAQRRPPQCRWLREPPTPTHVPRGRPKCAAREALVEVLLVNLEVPVVCAGIALAVATR